MVHTDRVGTQLGHTDNVALALGLVDQRIVGGELIGDTWDLLVMFHLNEVSQVPRTLDVVLGSILVEELGADSGNSRNGAHGEGLQAGQQQWG